MSRTLNQLIAAAIDGGEEVEETSTPTVEVRREASENIAPATDLDDIEKLASALEFIGRTGLDNLLEKVAADGSCFPDGTNMRQMHRKHVQSQVGPHASAPPMNPPGFGKMPNNEKKRPGANKGSVDTAAHGKGTHHPALASNEAAINYDKREKAKKVAPALSAILDNAAFADDKLKENLSNASGKGDKNIKRAHDLNAIKAELARRAVGRA